MKIVLAQNMFYLPSHGGANKSNRLMLEHLSATGHECHAVAPLTGRLRHLGPEALVRYLGNLGAEVLEHTERRVVYRRAGVTVHGVLRGPELPRTARDVLAQVEPDWTVVPSDDPGMLMLSAALRHSERVLYLVHTLQQLPFGPRSFYPSEAGTALVRRAAGLVSVSRAAQDYVLEHSGLPSRLIHPDVYRDPAPKIPAPGRQRFVTMVNPCAYKGIDILLELARSLPEVPFLAVDSWGTTDLDRERMRECRNILQQPSVDNVDEFLGRTRALIMPSLWDETFGYTCVEAMLRGIPVLASDVGGLREAALGTATLLPVAPITTYPTDGRPKALPDAVVPRQDVTPWRSELERLLADETYRQERGDAGRAAAEGFVASLDPDDLGRYLAELNSSVSAGVAG